MSDTHETEGTEAEEAATTEEKPKPVKVIKQPHSCLCSSYEVVDKTDDKQVFTTGCTQTTMSKFAQGHDARLVSFLVDGFADGYQIRQVRALSDGETEVIDHDTPADALVAVSEPLAEKANRATLLRKDKAIAAQERKDARERVKAERLAEKAKAKAERDAAKAAAQAEHPIPLQDGEVQIRVGETDFIARLDEDGNAVYRDGETEKVAALGTFEVLAI